MQSKTEELKKKKQKENEKEIEMKKGRNVLRKHAAQANGILNDREEREHKEVKR